MQVVNAQDQFLCSLTVGDHFGEFAAFGVTAERAATVVAGAHSTAYIITPSALSCVIYFSAFAHLQINATSAAAGGVMLFVLERIFINQNL